MSQRSLEPERCVLMPFDANDLECSLELRLKHIETPNKTENGRDVFYCNCKVPEFHTL